MRATIASIDMSIVGWRPRLRVHAWRAENRARLAQDGRDRIV